MSSSLLPILLLPKSALHLNENGEHMKGGEKSHFKPTIHPIQRYYTHVNEWIRADYGGVNENCKTRFIWSFKGDQLNLRLLLTCCFYASASATKMESSTHLKCHYCHVFFHLMQKLESSKVDLTVQQTKKCLSKRLKTNAKSFCTTKCYLDVQLI